jgi:hypothetical protein
MQKPIVVIAATILLAGCNVQNVDVALPVAAGEKFYGALKSGDGKTALAQFSPEFKSQVDNWPWILGELQQKYGLVNSAELQSSSLAANDDGPCYSLNYAVKRGAFASSEILFLCSRGGSSPWLIHGHVLTRLDTQQTVTGGMLPKGIWLHGRLCSCHGNDIRT